MEEGGQHGSKRARPRPAEEPEVLGGPRGLVSSEAGPLALARSRSALAVVLGN